MAKGSFYYVRNKRTNDIVRVSALPYMGQNSVWEEVEDPRLATEEPEPAKKKKKAAAKKALDADNSDLTAGLDDAEDSG